MVEAPCGVISLKLRDLFVESPNGKRSVPVGLDLSKLRVEPGSWSCSDADPTVAFEYITTAMEWNAKAKLDVPVDIFDAAAAVEDGWLIQLAAADKAPDHDAYVLMRGSGADGVSHILCLALQVRIMFACVYTSSEEAMPTAHAMVMQASNCVPLQSQRYRTAVSPCSRLS